MPGEEGAELQTPEMKLGRLTTEGSRLQIPVCAQNACRLTTRRRGEGRAADRRLCGFHEGNSAKLLRNAAAWLEAGEVREKF
jgi:hypothetical protein